MVGNCFLAVKNSSIFVESHTCRSALGCTFRVESGDVLSGTGIPAAVEEASSSGGVLIDRSSELQLRNLP